LVTAERVRSTLDEERRSRPASPMAAASWPGYDVDLAADHGSTVETVKPLRLLQIAPQIVNLVVVFCLGL
jgi:hypothetical protein